MPATFADPFVQRPPTASRPLLGETVLVVEDSRFACEALRLLCQRSGARIRRADSLRSARRHLQAFRPTVVIVDLGLPDGSGESLIRDLAAASPRIGAIIGMSGDDGAAERALGAGADAFLAKPIATVGEFQETILAVLPDRRPGLRKVSAETVTPDRLAVRDDLARIAEALDTEGEVEGLDYIAQFLLGVAKSAGDAELAEAAGELAQADQPASPRVARLSDMIRERLSGYDAFAA
ncbi:response regulator [Roseitranquillus sediminis]|uniref:response regulator n=1 Tax=Roseitranquillus sediminis TaxID=2809051 RepID=UPI001D0CD901|nr:response regulator [Roseitranquillus sediminis]MBM9594956.1 response regulator [Roseitranquillus sediminis]